MTVETRELVRLRELLFWVRHDLEHAANRSPESAIGAIRENVRRIDQELKPARPVRRRVLCESPHYLKGEA